MSNNPCPQCGQVWSDRTTGEYPCSRCGMPRLHDQASVVFVHEPTEAEAIADLRAELNEARSVARSLAHDISVHDAKIVDLEAIERWDEAAQTAPEE